MRRVTQLPVSFSANISDRKEPAQDQVLGKEIEYTRIISPTEKESPINTHKLLFNGSMSIIFQEYINRNMEVTGNGTKDFKTEIFHR